MLDASGATSPSIAGRAEHGISAVDNSTIIPPLEKTGNPETAISPQEEQIMPMVGHTAIPPPCRTFDSSSTAVETMGFEVPSTEQANRRDAPAFFPQSAQYQVALALNSNETGVPLSDFHSSRDLVCPCDLYILWVPTDLGYTGALLVSTEP